MEHTGDRYIQAVAAYLERMGIELEPPFSLKALAGELESDSLPIEPCESERA